MHFWELHYSKPKHRTKNIYPTSKLDSSLKIYVSKFQIGINDTFRVIRISVKAIFSIFSEVFRAYHAIQWDFWDSKNSFGNISSTSIRIYNVLNWKKYFSILKITFSFKINPKIGIFSRFLVNNIFTMKNVLNFIFSFNWKWKGVFKTVTVFLKIIVLTLWNWYFKIINIVFLNWIRRYAR